MLAKAVNIHRGDAYDEYIGRRKHGMHFGNPFSDQPSTLAAVLCASRDEAIRLFRAWLDGRTHQDLEPERRAWILANLPTLAGKRLGCFCKPLACHGDVLAELAEAGA